MTRKVSHFTMECNICFEKIMDSPAGLHPHKKLKTSSSNTAQKIERISCTPCGHLFHTECLKEWFNTTIAENENPTSTACQGTCPSCRKDLSMSDLIKVYPTVSSFDSGKLTELAQCIRPAATFSDCGEMNCENENCQLSQIMLELLRKDFEELVKKLIDEKERANTLEGMLKSLQNCEIEHSEVKTIENINLNLDDNDKDEDDYDFELLMK